MDDAEVLVRFDERRHDWTVRRDGEIVARRPTESEAFRQAVGIQLDDDRPLMTVRVIDRNGVARDRLGVV